MDAAMNAAVSALKSESQALSTISNNLANSGTTGYKSVSTQFLSLLSSASGGNSYPAGGVASVARQNVTLEGNIVSSTTTTDMAIDGNGFFVVTKGTGNTSSSSTTSSTTSSTVSSSTNTFYTRNGAFNTDESGNLYLSGTNYYLMGWPTDSNGNVTATNQDNVASLEQINVKKYNSTASATTEFTMQANLPDAAQNNVQNVSYTNSAGSTATLNYSWVSTGTNSTGNSTYLVSVTPSNSSTTLDDGSGQTGSQLTYTVETDTTGNIVSVTGTTNGTSGYSGTELPTSITPSDASASVDTSAKTWSTVKATTGFSKSTTMSVYDSLGTEESFPVTWTAAGDNTWVMTVKSPTIASGSSQSGNLLDSSGTTVSSYSYAVKFNSDGTLKDVSALSEMNGSTISTAPVNSSAGPELSASFANYDGAANSAVTLNLGTAGKADGLTQYDTGDSTLSVNVKSTSKDGVQYGALESVSVASSGEIMATYSNGQKVSIYKVALATFSNPNGLSAMNDSVYQSTTDSGSYSLNEAGANGTGSIDGSSLESSTVDTSTEFSNMITCQQAYQAASQVISTGKQMFSTLLQSVQ